MQNNHTDDVGRLAAFNRRYGGHLPDPERFQLNRADRRAEAAKRGPFKKQPKWMDPSHLQGLTEDEKKHLSELNKLYGTGLLGSCFRIIFEPGNGKPVKFLSSRDAAMRESARLIWQEGSTKGSLKKIKAFQHWLEWDGHRDYEEIKFAPGCDDPSIFNLFHGWAVKPKDGDWSFLREHIHHIICNGNADQFAWFMTWLAHIFQFPADKRSVAVVIRGEKGTGKSIVFDFIQRLLPGYFYKVADGNRALGNFNSHYEHTLLLLMEEAFWAGDQAKESILKDLITSPSIVIERKGIDTYMAKNHMRVAMISNERWVVPAAGRERRFAVFDCGSQHRNDIPYFKAMAQQMNNGGLEAMLHDLLNYVPGNGWDVLFTPPVTAGLGEQVIESLRGIDRFMYELLINGGYECDGLEGDGIRLDEIRLTSISMRDLRIAARDYLTDHFTGHKAATYDMIQSRVIEWFGATVDKRKSNANNGRWVTFPPLSECREHVLRTKGIEIAEPDEEPAGADKPASSKLH